MFGDTCMWVDSVSSSSVSDASVLVSQASRIFPLVCMHAVITGRGREGKIRLVTLARFSSQAGM